MRFPEMAHHRKTCQCSQISSKGLSLLKVFQFINKNELERIYIKTPESSSLSFRVKDDRWSERNRLKAGWFILRYRR